MNFCFLNSTIKKKKKKEDEKEEKKNYFGNLFSAHQH